MWHHTDKQTNKQSRHMTIAWRMLSASESSDYMALYKFFYLLTSNNYIISPKCRLWKIRQLSIHASLFATWILQKCSCHSQRIDAVWRGISYLSKCLTMVDKNTLHHNLMLSTASSCTLMFSSTYASTNNLLSPFAVNMVCLFNAYFVEFEESVEESEIYGIRPRRDAAQWRGEAVWKAVQWRTEANNCKVGKVS